MAENTDTLGIFPKDRSVFHTLEKEDDMSESTDTLKLFFEGLHCPRTYFSNNLNVAMYPVWEAHYSGPTLTQRAWRIRRIWYIEDYKESEVVGHFELKEATKEDLFLFFSGLDEPVLSFSQNGNTKIPFGYWDATAYYLNNLHYYCEGLKEKISYSSETLWTRERKCHVEA